MQIKKDTIRNVWLFLTVMTVFFICFDIKPHAEEDNYETWLQSIYSSEQGLSVGKANDIDTTSDGIIWVGTYAGLYRYNGSRFQLMKQYDTVKSVECLYVDDEDRLWVGTNDDGISVLKNEEVIDVIDDLPSHTIRSIVKGSDGYYYIGTSDCMAVVSFQNEKAEIVKTIPEIEYADKSTADQQGNVIVISSYGKMFLLNQGEIQEETEIQGEDQFTACVFDTSGKVHVGTSLGNVLIYEVKDKRFQQISTLECSGIRKVNNLIRVNKKTIFVCADNGIGYFDKNDTFHFLETPNFTSSIYNVMLDYQGNLWFASSRMGLLRLCKTNFVELFTQYSISSNVVNSIESFQDKLYVGTDNGLVIIDEKQKKKIENDITEQLKNIRIRQIVKDHEGILWICTYGRGLARYDGESLEYIDQEGKNIGKKVRTILEKSTGELLVSSENGITVIQDGKVIKTLTDKNGLKNKISLCLLEKPNGTILIGSDGNGIVKIDGEEISSIDRKNGLPSDIILRMVNDTEENGVFVVTGNGLCYMDANEKVHVLDNFPYSNNYDLIQHDENVFVLGSSGIYAVLRDELLKNQENMKYTFLDSRAGLHDSLVANSWNMLQKEDEKIYMATNTGVTAFDLKAYDDRPVDFKVRVASITVDGEQSTMQGEESFAFDKKVKRLEINPEIINYSTVDPIISCYLEGFDEQPIIMPQSELTTIVYTNLPEGKYKFHIMLVNSESGVSISEKVYYLEKETNFTDTIWFYVLIIGGVILIGTWVLFFIIREMYIRTINAKERELKASWKMSVTDALTGLKNRFAMNTEFRQNMGKSMNIIMMDIDYFKQFNDDYGHDMGDEVLRRVSEVILKYYEEPRVAIRFGGDEFLLWDPCIDEEKSLDYLRQMVEEINQIRIDGCDDKIHISFGSVFGAPKTEEEFKELIAAADKKLYKAKNKR